MSGEGEASKQREEENRKLKHVVAELTPDKRALEGVLTKPFGVVGLGQPLAS